ncbi:DUF1802 family protein [Aphanothece sacrum]|nr:DUF1802 family protein [Aphanothece sacrum]
MLTQLNYALKEWNVTINALAKGQTILLLRKGGIREIGGRFNVKYDQVLLYPTYEHQNPNLLKSKYSSDVIKVNSGWHPETISITSWTKITDIFVIPEKSTLDLLFNYHIWNQEFISDRFNWKPNQPLYLLLLKVYLLPNAGEINYQSEYGGCRSWLELNQTIDISKSVPVLDDHEYDFKVEDIKKVITRIKE